MELSFHQEFKRECRNNFETPKRLIQDWFWTLADITLTKEYKSRVSLKVLPKSLSHKQYSTCSCKDEKDKEIQVYICISENESLQSLMFETTDKFACLYLNLTKNSHSEQEHNRVRDNFFNLLIGNF